MEEIISKVLELNFDNDKIKTIKHRLTSKDGSQLNCIYPEHGDLKASARLNKIDDNYIYHCFGCGKSANQYGLYADIFTNQSKEKNLKKQKTIINKYFSNFKKFNEYKKTNINYETNHKEIINNYLSSLFKIDFSKYINSINQKELIINNLESLIKNNYVHFYFNSDKFGKNKNILFPINFNNNLLENNNDVFGIKRILENDNLKTIMPSLTDKNLNIKDFIVPNDIWDIPNEQNDIFFVEGEKDMLLLRLLGYQAYSFLGGANAFDNNSTSFQLIINKYYNANFYILSDKDDAGENFKDALIYGITRVNKNANIYNLNQELFKYIEHKNDISDFLLVCQKENKSIIEQIDEFILKTEKSDINEYVLSDINYMQKYYQTFKKDSYKNIPYVELSRAKKDVLQKTKIQYNKIIGTNNDTTYMDKYIQVILDYDNLESIIMKNKGLSKKENNYTLNSINFTNIATGLTLDNNYQFFKDMVVKNNYLVNEIIKQREMNDKEGENLNKNISSKQEVEQKIEKLYNILQGNCISYSNDDYELIFIEDSSLINLIIKEYLYTKPNIHLKIVFKKEEHNNNIYYKQLLYIGGIVKNKYGKVQINNLQYLKNFFNICQIEKLYVLNSKINLQNDIGHELTEDEFDEYKKDIIDYNHNIIKELNNKKNTSFKDLIFKPFEESLYNSEVFIGVEKNQNTISFKIDHRWILQVVSIYKEKAISEGTKAKEHNKIWDELIEPTIINIINNNYSKAVDDVKERFWFWLKFKYYDMGDLITLINDAISKDVISNNTNIFKSFNPINYIFFDKKFTKNENEMIKWIAIDTSSPTVSPIYELVNINENDIEKLDKLETKTNTFEQNNININFKILIPETMLNILEPKIGDLFDIDFIPIAINNKTELVFFVIDIKRMDVDNLNKNLLKKSLLKYKNLDNSTFEKFLHNLKRLYLNYYYMAGANNGFPFETYLPFELTYNSVSAYSVQGTNGTMVKKGALDTLIVGSSQTGKSAVKNLFINIHKASHSEDVSSTTINSLLGGSKGDNSIYQGIFAEYNRKLLVFEELSGAPELTKEFYRAAKSSRLDGKHSISRVESNIQIDSFTRLISITNAYNQTTREIENLERILEKKPNQTILHIIFDLFQDNSSINRFGLISATYTDNNKHYKKMFIEKEKDLTPIEEIKLSDIRLKTLWIWNLKESNIIVSDKLNAYIKDKSYKKLIKPYEISDDATYLDNLDWLVNKNMVVNRVTSVALAICAWMVNSDDEFKKLYLEEKHIDYAIELFLMMYKTLLIDSFVNNYKNEHMLDTKQIMKLISVNTQIKYQKEKYNSVLYGEKSSLSDEDMVLKYTPFSLIYMTDKNENLVKDVNKQNIYENLVKVFKTKAPLNDYKFVLNLPMIELYEQLVQHTNEEIKDAIRIDILNDGILNVYNNLEKISSIDKTKLLGLYGINENNNINLQDAIKQLRTFFYSIMKDDDIVIQHSRNYNSIIVNLKKVRQIINYYRKIEAKLKEIYS